MQDERDQKEKVKRTSITGDGNVIGDHSHATIIKQTILPPVSPPIPHQIPPPPLDFTGRDDEIKELENFDKGSIIVGVRGLGGIGKTALAYKLAEKLQDRYPDGQIMVNMLGMTEPISPAEAMAHVIRAYHPEAKIPDDENETRGLYLSILDGKRTLILFDNALDDKQVLKLLPPSTCGVLITSRNTIKLPGFVRKNLEILSPEDSINLLLKIFNPLFHDNDLKKANPAWPEIARLCGYLPLALRAAASLLANTPDLRPNRYAEKLKDEATRLEMIGEEGVELSFDASFNLSFSYLDPKIRKTFLNMYVFPADFDGQAEENICQDEGHKRLSELVRWSLVEYQRPSSEGEGRYHLHDLVRLFAAGLLVEQEGEVARNDAQKRHATYFRGVLSSAIELYKNDNALSGLRRFDLERINIEAAWAWAKKNFAENDVAASICNAFLNWPYLLQLRINSREMISRLETALASARQLKDKRMEGIHLGNLGLAYADLGEVRKAFEYYKQALAIGREIGDRLNEGVWLNNLGLAHADLGEARKAIEYYEQALTIFCEIRDRRGEGNTLGNMGSAYHRLSEYRKALEYYKQALAIAREIGDRLNEGVWLGNMGLAYAALGDARKAFENFEQALIISREIGDKRNEGAWLGNMGLAYAALGDARKAIEYYEQQLLITREIGDRSGEGNALFNMGVSLEKLNERKTAIDLAKTALRIYEQIESPLAEKVGQHLANWEETK